MSRRRTKQEKNKPIVAKAAITTASGVVLADWQHLPRQILHEHVQKNKTYAKPSYQPAKCLQQDQHRCRVVLKHLKNEDKTLTFSPNECFESFELAKEWAALLALQNLCRGLALERKFPEPFKSAWLSLSTTTPSVTTNARFHCEYDRQQAKRESEQNKKRSANIKETREHFQRGLNKLTIDDEHHQMLEHVLRSHDHAQGRTHLPLSVSKTVASQLIKLGFHQDDIDRALAESPFSPSDLDPGSAQNTALQWILVNVAERRLPASYRSKQSEAVVAVRGSIGAIENLSVLDQLRRLGYPSIACELAVQCHSDCYHQAKLWLWNKMVDFLSVERQLPIRTLSPTELQNETEAELLALSAIYDDAFDVDGDGRSWSLRLTDLQLRLRIETVSGYPGAVPVIDIVSDRLSAVDRICLAQALVTAVALKAAAEISPVTHECVEFLRQNLSQVLESCRPRWPTAWLLNAPPASTSSQSLSTKPKPIVKKPFENDESLNGALRDKWRQRSESVQFKAVLRSRSRLPVWRHRQRLLDAVMNNQVVVICAETGSGKSTQIPAFLLDEDVERGRGAVCRVICTQPRRISAVSLAERVSQEYCEKIGETVGYRIRLESKISNDTRIEYVTNGLLLRQLLTDPDLHGVSHIVLDEVHERSVEIDLLLLVLRQVLRQRPSMKLILMSATLQSDLLSSYFNGCPTVHIPGRTFPVSVFYVKDIITSTGYFPSERYRIKSKSHPAADDCHHDGAVSDRTRSALLSLNPDICNIDLLIVAIWHVISTYTTDTGAILCFLPGVGEIRSSIRQFKRSIDDRQLQQSDFMLVPLHGALSNQEQSKVFERPPHSTRKIIFATNVAETSITVNDVVFVIDTGRVRQMQFDAGRNVSMLVEVMVSRSNADQRCGRAGRVRPGICIRLFSRSQYDRLPLQHKSEMSRVSLDHVCLQIRGLLTSTKPLGEIFAEMIETPDPGAVSRAVSRLQSIGAFEPRSESLTGLGRHMCALPMDARLGKMLILGACLSCVTPIIRIAALLSVGSPFLGGADYKDDVYRTRLRFAGTSNSDHIALLRLYEGWLEARSQSNAALSQFCIDNVCSSTTLKSVMDLSFQYRDALAQLGFITVTEPSGSMNLGIRSDYDQNADDLNIITAVLTAGLFPNIIRVQYPEQRFHQTLSGVLPKSHDARSLRYYRGDGQRVFLHPGSVNFHASSFPYPYLAYLEERHTSKLYVYDTSVMALYPILMFGGQLRVVYDQNLILVDNWIKLEAPGRLGALVSGLREQLDQLLDRKVREPHFDIRKQDVVAAIIRLFLSAGGFV